MDVKSFFIRYLLFPVIVVITTAIMTIINKKNKLLNNKKLIIIILVTSIILGLPGLLGFLDLQFMPWGYLICQLYYLAIGILFVWLAGIYYETELLERKGFFFVCCLITCLLGVFLFKLGFDWLNDLKYGLWASSSVFVFLVPVVFWWAYIAFLNIPLEIYKVWQYPVYPVDISMEHLDFNRLLVLEVNLYKHTDDAEPLKVKAKAPRNMNFGLWFQKFIDDYNLKFPDSPIQYQNAGKDTYKWIFYIKPSFFKQRQFIDPDLDIEQNNITESFAIFAKRVSEVANAPVRKGDEAVYL
ncbi:TssN family type VI secretion system protein [Mucilaginibacter jinjuensis]|uniref:TssN family type VI secretion system protein n=1 Tax=Mucilaginibacter jinjuensis TaxID=1176721 RepID=A0ABY7T5E6_9SPHI|nr:TssN family type VI secretion system protein [Mucilaginibacter jinjuensis]WCT10477.1 TssN family type VI secretion system protein [Mucilaginibacter jinjuensis]